MFLLRIGNLLKSINVIPYSSVHLPMSEQPRLTQLLVGEVCFRDICMLPFGTIYQL